MQGCEAVCRCTPLRQKQNRPLPFLSPVGCSQLALEALAKRRFIRWSGRRGSNPRQPAWEAGGCKITACLAQTAFTGCLKSASSFSRMHEESCHMHFSRIPAKVVALPGRQVVMRFCTHQHYTLLLEKRQNAVSTLVAHWIYQRMCGVASSGWCSHHLVSDLGWVILFQERDDVLK